jgi:hypothetical protein
VELKGGEGAGLEYVTLEFLNGGRGSEVEGRSAGDAKNIARVDTLGRDGAGASVGEVDC